LAPFEQIAQLHAAGQTDEARKVYNSLNDQARYVYDNARNMERFTSAKAAELADEFRKMQDARTKASEDPLKQAQLEERRAKLQERKSVQTDFKIRRDNTIKNIEEILNDKSYASLVGPIDGTVGGVYDAAFNEKAQAKRAKLDRLVNFDVLDMTKYLRPISQDELKYLRTLVPGQTQNWEVYKQYLGEKLEMLKATDKAAFNPATSLPLAADDAPASAQPAAAAPPKYVVGKSYTDGKGQTGIFDGYNRDGTPKFSRPSR
jgi:multidrug efflux pump subunit AcrA (membrane-fusion protein)